ncbi:uncharacterized protein LOC132175806 [Corylus avellana]|uniref:uncharacterized protein LOC132175806 n=1 Tax=Corylus avellana TaxID=13451 RepID=UPI001E1F4E8C|nr:uncharacterized protein LOC132175806 [Corylus avellana]
MQRQSLGSPVSKHHGHGGAAKDDTLIIEEPKQRDRDDNNCDDDVEHKATKPHRVSLPLSPPQRPEKFIHVIPVLTFLCFLILYLSSHTPSQSDLAQFNGFQLPAKHLDSAEINDVGRFNEIKKGDVLAIRSLRNLQEIEKRSPKSRSHRKVADF